MSVVRPKQVQKSSGGKPTKHIAEISMSVGCLLGGGGATICKTVCSSRVDLDYQYFWIQFRSMWNPFGICMNIDAAGLGEVGAGLAPARTAHKSNRSGVNTYCIGIDLESRAGIQNRVGIGSLALDMCALTI